MSRGYGDIGSDPYHRGSAQIADRGQGFDDGKTMDAPFPKITRDQLDRTRRFVAGEALDVDDALELADMLGIKPSQVKGSRYVEGETEAEPAPGARDVRSFVAEASR